MKWQDILAALRTALLAAIAAILGWGPPAPAPPAPPAPPPAPIPPPPAPPPAPIPPPPKTGPLDPVAARVKLQHGSAGCTGTFIHLDGDESAVYVLTAAHCTGAIGTKGTARTVDGKTYKTEVFKRHTGRDVCLLKVDAPRSVAYAKVAEKDAELGADVWHKGYGIDRPDNVEQGKVSGTPGGDGMHSFRLSVSSGDSGSGIFRADTGEIVGVVCCYGSGRTYGASPSSIRAVIYQKGD
jgi:Trypsin-like peptidase domain